MGRPRKIWKRDGSKYYYTKIDGKQVRLEKTKGKSQEKVELILQGGVRPGTGKTFASVADEFLDHSKRTNDPETFKIHQLVLQSFKDHVGQRLVVRLCEADLDKWELKLAQTDRGQVKHGGRTEGLTRKARPWAESSRTRAKAIVLAALNYGTRKLGLGPHPLAHVRPGSVGSRERYLTPEEREKIRQAVSGPFAEYIFALEQTGARPFSEVAKVTAANVDLEKGTWTLGRWKNSKKQKGKKRVIYLTEDMLQLTRRLVLKNPDEGPLFRNRIGKPWTRQALTARFRKLGEELGIEGLKAYHLRHCYISDALARGVPVAVVAELCGTSIQTINKHYSHIDKKQDVLREAARKAVGA